MTAVAEEEKIRAFINEDLEYLLSLEQENNQLDSSDFVELGDKPEKVSLVGLKPDNNIRWIERATTYFLPNVNCTFEVSYNNPLTNLINFGFNVQWQRLPYSLRCTNRYLLYCTVKESSPEFSSLIGKGDIILKFNDENLFFQPGDEVNYDQLDKKFQDIKLPICNLKILRPASNTGSLLISPTEIILFAQEKTISAKFIISIKLNKDNIPKINIETVNFDQNAPIAVKKMMQLSRPVWTHIPVLKEGNMDARITISKCLHQQQSSTASTVNFNAMLHPHATVFHPTISVHDITKQEEQIYANVVTPGVYRDKNKFVAIFVGKPSSSNSIQSIPAVSAAASSSSKVAGAKRKRADNNYLSAYNLGRFDSEEEAWRAYMKVSTCHIPYYRISY
jgi:hypothetical protein